MSPGPKDACEDKYCCGEMLGVCALDACRCVQFVHLHICPGPAGQAQPHSPDVAQPG